MKLRKVRVEGIKKEMGERKLKVRLMSRMMKMMLL